MEALPVELVEEWFVCESFLCLASALSMVTVLHKRMCLATVYQPTSKWYFFRRVVDEEKFRIRINGL